MKKTDMLNESEVKLLRILAGGKYLNGILTKERSSELGQMLGCPPNSVRLKIRRMEDMGVISGYVPVLSEDGIRILEALETAYGLVKDGKTTESEPLSRLME